MVTPSFTDDTFMMNILLHLIAIKLGLTNYLLWKNQMFPLFSYQKLTNHINGTPTPPKEIVPEDKLVPNPVFENWTDKDQQAVILLNSSLIEEVATYILGLSNAHDIWIALELTHNISYVEKIHFLCDYLRQITKGTSIVSDYDRNFQNYL